MPPPPGPVKISYKKDGKNGRQRWSHRFHVSWPPCPGAGSVTIITHLISHWYELSLYTTSSMSSCRPKFSQFHAVLGKLWQNDMLVAPGGSAPLRRRILDPLLCTPGLICDSFLLFITARQRSGKSNVFSDVCPSFCPGAEGGSKRAVAIQLKCLLVTLYF